MTGLALGCQIPEHSKFDRKNYPYPDLMKGYQISQYDLPFAVKGCLEIRVDGQTKVVGVERVHLEEDVAKLQHFSGGEGEAYSLVDVNRSGVPLMEIVSMPDMRSPEEARAYLTSIHSIVQYLGVSTANMQDGSFRCDANISIRPQGATELGTRSEVKNMNSFRSVFQALNYEVRATAPGGGGRCQSGPGNPRLAGRPGRYLFPAEQGIRPRLSLLSRAGFAPPGGGIGLGGPAAGSVAGASLPAEAAVHGPIRPSRVRRGPPDRISTHRRLL